MSNNATELLQEARQAMQEGRLEQAGRLFRDAVRDNPDQVESHYWLGIFARKEGDETSAAEHFEAAVRVAKASGSLLLGECLMELGLTRQNLGQSTEATECFQAIRDQAPAYVEGQSQQADEHRKAGRNEQALEACERGLRVAENHPHLLQIRLLLCEADQDWCGSYTILKKLTALQPQNAGLNFALARAAEKSGDRSESIAALKRTLRINSEHPEAALTLGLQLHQVGCHAEALDYLAMARRREPDRATIHDATGNMHRALGNFSQASVAWEKAVQLDPSHAGAWQNLGLGLEYQDQLMEAITCHRQVVELQPGNAQAQRYLGSALQDAGRLDEAMQAYDRAIELSPENAEAHWGRFYIMALRGQFPQAWDEYEWRWKLKNRTTPRLEFPQPAWEGEKLEGKTLFLHSEQGYGDTIQAIRYAPLLKERGARVMVGCPPSLARLLQSAPGVDAIVTGSAQRISFDFHQALFSLPRVFRTSLETIPGESPYLFPPPEQAAALPRDSGKKKAGLVWSGSVSQDNDRRPIQFSNLLTILDFSEFDYFSFQLGFAALDPARHGIQHKITDLGPLLTDFATTTTLVQEMDLMITIDTAMAHLSGALGTPTLLLLSAVPDWRWMLRRTDCPWYQSMQIHRQTSLMGYVDNNNLQISSLFLIHEP